MTVDYGTGTTEYGPGVLLTLDGDELAEAVDAYLVAKGVLASGPRTVRVNGGPCESARVYVDPSGRVLVGGMPFSGRGPDAPAVADDCYITGGAL